MSTFLSRPVTRILFLALALPTAVLAQTADTVDLNGVVLDASGRPAAGYPMHVVTSQWGQVIMKPTEHDGTFAVSGLPPGSYEFRVFEPGGSTDNPIASKQVTVAAGQKERIEIRLGAHNSGGAATTTSAAGLAAAGTTLGVSGVNWTAIQIAGVVLAGVFLIFYFVRAQRRPT